MESVPEEIGDLPPAEEERRHHAGEKNRLDEIGQEKHPEFHPAVFNEIPDDL